MVSLSFSMTITLISIWCTLHLATARSLSLRLYTSGIALLRRFCNSLLVPSQTELLEGRGFASLYLYGYQRIWYIVSGQ